MLRAKRRFVSGIPGKSTTGGTRDDGPPAEPCAAATTAAASPSHDDIKRAAGIVSLRTCLLSDSTYRCIFDPPPTQRDKEEARLAAQLSSRRHTRVATLTRPFQRAHGSMTSLDGITDWKAQLAIAMVGGVGVGVGVGYLLSLQKAPTARSKYVCS